MDYVRKVECRGLYLYGSEALGRVSLTKCPLQTLGGDDRY